MSRDLEYELNRLANTLSNGAPTVSAQRAANAWNSTVGNFQGPNELTANQISVETNTTGFTASNSSLARASGGLVGTYCLQVTCSAANGGFTMLGGTSSGTKDIDANQRYTFRVAVKAATITRTVYAKVFWWQADGSTAASTASNTGTGVVLSTSWADVEVVATAPSNAAKCSLQLYAASSANTEVYLADRIGFWQGASTDWNQFGPGVGVAMEYDLIGALNRKAGITDPKAFIGLDAVCNLLASTSNLDAVAALRAIP